MTPERAELYRQLLAFDIDGPTPVSLSFAARLARENGWDRVYAERVIREYKRYVFLAMTVGRPMTPSEEVDQAWHLHLSYSKSYWTRMCGELLKTPLHHNPTAGGSAEHNKHLKQYDDTLRSYREMFGHDAPADIWPSAQVRFGPDAEGVRVVTHQNWVVPKRQVKQIAVTLAASLAIAVSIGCAGGLNPFELEGIKYLWFLIPTMIAAIVVGNIYVRFARRPGPDSSVDPTTLTWEQAAYLAGQKNRLTTAAIARLVQRQFVAIEGHGDQLVRVKGSPEPESAVERAVLKEMPLDRTEKNALSRLADSVEGAYAEEIHKLEEAGLLLTKVQAKSVAFFGALPLALVVAGLGVPRLVAGFMNGKPVGFLVVTVIVGGILSFLFMFGKYYRTRRADAVLQQLKTINAKLKSGRTWSEAPTHSASPEMTAAMAVALFGTAVLLGSPLDRLRTWYPRQTTENSGSGCSTGCNSSGGSGCSGGDSGGGGDGGGSGCGGCGGGGD